MSEPKKTKTQAKMPIQDIYKVHIMDEKGLTGSILIFCRNTIDNNNISEIFSESEIEKIKEKNIPLIYSRGVLHKDDSISTIKKKIMHELNESMSYEEMYLFAHSLYNIDSLYDSMVSENTSLNKQTLQQLFVNMNLNENEIENLMERIKDTSHITYDDFKGLLDFDKKYNLSIPLGQKFSKEMNYFFSANPYKLVSGEVGLMTNSNSLITLENNLLLNYGDLQENTIYLCRIRQVVQSFETKQNVDLLSDVWIKTYFPLLYVKSITSMDDFIKEEPKLLQSSEELIQTSTLHFFDTVDIFYDIFHSRGEIELPYLKRGIKEMEIRIKSEMNISLPLEVIFKNIHSDKETPFIKYNPGTRRENIYRLYTEKKTADGKNIPYLSESTVLKLSKETGKHKEISLFTQHVNEKGEITHVFIDLEMNGDVFVHYELKTPLMSQQMTEFTQQIVNPVITHLNRFLEQTGYKIKKIDSLKDPFIEIVNMKYVTEIELEKEIHWDKYMGCITSIFDILEENNREIRMRFKRVENFMEMDAQSLLMTEVFKRTQDINQVIMELMKNYKMTEDAAKIRVIQYLGEHKDIRGKIVDNPGFPVLFKIDKQLTIEVKHIVSIEYVDVLQMYLDALLRLTLHFDAITVDKKYILKTCAKTEKTAPMKNNIDNVVTTTILPPVLQLKDIHAIQLMDDDEASEEGGIFFGDEDEGEDIPFEKEKNIPISSEEAPVPEEEAPVPEEEEAPVPEEEETPVPEEEAPVPEEEETPVPEEEEEISPQTSSSSLSEKGIFFEEEEESEESEKSEKSEKSEEEEEEYTRPKRGGKKRLVVKNVSPSPEENASPEENLPFKIKQIVGKSLKHPNLFYSSMKQREPELFSVEEDKNYTSYSRVCASNLKLQPVILTQKEFDKINQENPDSYSDYAKYGSDPSKPFYYICPRYWCLLNNTSMTDEDVRQGKCAKRGVPDKIIPKDAKTVPSDAFVYEFNNPKEHLNDKGEYVTHYPGFKKGKHPKGFGLPCCFKKPKQNWAFNQEAVKPKKGRPIQKKADYLDKEENEKNVLYVISYDTFPIRQKNRFGFLPQSVQLFLQTDNNACVTKNNPALIKSDTECLLRFGVEQVLHQSILGTVAELYAHSQDLKNTPSVAELKNIMKTAITLDKFLFYNNSYLVSVFRPKVYREVDTTPYLETEFYKKLNVSNEYENDFLEDTIASYENFIDYIMSDDSNIDHTYLWDIITDDNPLFIKGGINLVIIEIANNDVTDNIKLLCPTNSIHKRTYDPRKETAILLKRDEFYEPIYIYKENGGKIKSTQTFYAQTPLKNIKKILNMIDKHTQKKCGVLPSQPKIYSFKKNIPLDTLFRLLSSLQYTVQEQIMNYQGKIIGVLTSPGEGTPAVFVPCFPSASMNNTPVQFMDTAGIWTDYQSTLDALTALSEASDKKIPCLPKIKVLEDNLVVGFLSETNQFIQIDPPSENIMNDSMPSLSASNYNTADKIITTTQKVDTEREIMIHKISLESQFFNLFRTTARQLLNEFENRETREKIVKMIQNDSIPYKKKLQQVIEWIRSMMSYKFSFSTIDDNVLMTFQEISCFAGECGEETESLCIKKEDGSCQMILPSKHLISGLDNERAYYGRVADELIRYKRIQLFMLHPKTYLNLTNVDYKINENEFILLQSSLNNDYLKNLVAYNFSENIHHLNYVNAKPQITQTYVNEPVPLKEQYAVDNQPADFQIHDYIYECVKETKEVIGNAATSYWKRLFPDKSKEMVFKNTSNECSFFILLYMFQDKYREPVSVQSVKTSLWNDGYKDLYGLHKDSILKVLKKQGKHDLVSKIRADKYTLETAIMSNEYYITDLDIWMFAKSAKIQMCLFSSFRLKSLDESVEWILTGNLYKEKHYFVRVPTNIVANKVSSYNLITPAFGLGELPEFENQLQGILSGAGGEKNIQTIQQFLRNVA